MEAEALSIVALRVTERAMQSLYLTLPPVVEKLPDWLIGEAKPGLTLTGTSTAARPPSWYQPLSYENMTGVV